MAALPVALPSSRGQQVEEPRARRLSRELSAAPRLAGTRGSERAAAWVAEHLRAAGFEVELDAREVLLSYPRRLEVHAWRTSAPSAHGGDDGEDPGPRAADVTLFHRIERFDPDRRPAGDVPKYNAWSASGEAQGTPVDVGRGLRADYERLARGGVEVAGRIALARYGGAYRGVKAELAEEHGCLALLLFNDPEEDGPVRGPVWPAGPHKPGWAAQRGSIGGLARVPGDPSTPGWPSPAWRPASGASSASGEPSAADRLEGDALHRVLPAIPCLPIGSSEALALIEAGAAARLRLELDVPRTYRRIVNVIGRLPGTGDGQVLAGNHRDAWVRGAQDAGSGTVSLLRAAERLGQRVADGWRPMHSIVLGFWDAEEFGLIGSTEWGEAHAEELRARGIAYVNADAVVSGTTFRASGTPGLVGVLRRALERVPAPDPSSDGPRNLLAQWTRDGQSAPDFGLPGSGSDYTVFLHHLGLPVIDVSFGGRPGGQYHTAFDDFAMMDRFLDPTWGGHEAAGHLLAELLARLSDEGHAAFDDEEAARDMARLARETTLLWLEEAHRERIAQAFESLAETIGTARDPEDALAPAPFYRFLERQGGLPDRPWYRNELWAPGLETGYAAETFPVLRAAASSPTHSADGGQALTREVQALVERIAALERLWDGAGGAR